MPELNEAAFAAGMQQLRNKFIESIPERIAPIEKYLTAEFNDAVDEQAARLELHRLAGAAGSLGFADLAAVVQELERHLQIAANDEQARGIFSRLFAVIEAMKG